MYSWEFFTTLGYEWRVIQDRSRYRWTIWVSTSLGYSLSRRNPKPRLISLVGQIYSLARVAGLLGMVVSLIGIDVTTQINCQVGAAFRVCLSTP